jgi:hypothetical protein
MGYMEHILRLPEDSFSADLRRLLREHKNSTEPFLTPQAFVDRIFEVFPEVVRILI